MQFLLPHLLIGSQLSSFLLVLRNALSKMLLIAKPSCVFSDFILVNLPAAFIGISFFLTQNPPSHDPPYTFSSFSFYMEFLCWFLLRFLTLHQPLDTMFSKETSSVILVFKYNEELEQTLFLQSWTLLSEVSA